MSKFTPWPWFYDSGVFYSESQLDPNNPPYIKREEMPIAEMIGGSEANARLIAAAPAMYEALQKILAVKRTVDLNLFDIEAIHSIAEAALRAADGGK